MPLNETHRPELTSWVESAQTPGGDFPIQNLPFGIFRRAGTPEPARVGVAIGDQIVDLSACLAGGLFTGRAAAAAERCAGPHLNALMELGPDAASSLRHAVSAVLRADSAAYRRDPAIARRILVPMYEAELRLPAQIGDYSDFYASIDHARNVGSMFRPDHPLLPNYKYVPVGYHGRASSIVLSDTHVKRPMGQVHDDPEEPPVFAASRRLDYELELGIFVGAGNPLGAPVPILEAQQHIFGFCLVNDWSARDIQTWEYQPLGPFLAKSFATSISPWVVTLEALEPYRAPAYARSDGDPAPLPHLYWESDQRQGGLAITLEVYLRSTAMRQRSQAPMRVSRGSFTTMYWTVAQLLTHHTSNGCNLRPGDLLASGTVSGPAKESRGCLLERTWRGREPLRLPTGETRSFLENGDEVIMRGFCEREGAARIGFGECAGIVIGAV